MIANVAWMFLIILVFIILYRLLLKRLKRKRPTTENYLTLHPVEPNPANGELQFFFEQNTPKNVRISIYDINGNNEVEIANAEFKKGGNIFTVDTTKFENGEYFIELKTDFQKTSKRFEIKN
tara:strand:+ start:162735 stop:163100 length:366 start_codon:yes stop_codon:yes gene_type:complete